MATISRRSTDPPEPGTPETQESAISELARVRAVARDLQAQVRTYETALSNTKDFNYIFDLEGRFLFVNRALLDLWGKRADEAVGKNFFELEYPLELAARLQQQIQEVIGTGESLRDETPFTSAIGEREYEYIFVPVFSGDGKVEAVAGSTRDITERRQAQRELQELTDQLQTVIETAPLGLYLVDDRFRIAHVNSTALPVFGGIPDLIGRDFDEVIHMLWSKEYADEVVELFRRTLQSGEPYYTPERIERRHDREAVEYYTWQLNRIPLREGRQGVVCYFRDISSSVFARQKLARSEERLRLILENAKEYAIISMDIDRRVTSWNAGAEAITGYTAAEILHGSGDVIFTDQDRRAGAPQAEARTAAETGRAVDERWHVAKDGRRFWASGVMTMMRDADGTAMGFLKVLRDETARRRDREALDEKQHELSAALRETESARAAAEAAGKAKDHFLAVLSHELRTPLTPVVMAVHVLSRRSDLPPQVLDSLAMIRRNIDVETHMIDELLDVTRIARGKMEITPDPLDISDILKHAIEVSRPEFRGNQQKLLISHEATRWTVSGDATRLTQVFWSLLKNASKFTPTGGEIRLRTYNEGEWFVAVVTDTGIGFDPSVGNKIFNPFEQADPTIARLYGGLGLGLAIAKAAVEAHGGTIAAASPGIDRGASFTVALPLV